LHYLIQVVLTFVILCEIMAILTLLKPLPVAKVLPIRKDIDLRTEPVIYLAWLWS